ncbi:MAG: MBL fold metallo-hydrolase, partial [Acidobacteriota bacterium]|nr:MBL fold metallo-hydrolase [Acidobacteriota bacterium]
RSTYEGRSAPNGEWVVLDEVDIEPTGYAGHYLLGYDANKKQVVELDTNNAGYALYTSPGWQERSLVLTSTGEGSYAVPKNRFVYTVAAADSFTVSWETYKASQWHTADLLRCRRTSVVNYSTSSETPARKLLHAAAEAMGGESALGQIHAVELKSIGFRNLLEQSERPEGPYLVDYQQTDDLRDFEHQSRLLRVERRGFSTPDWYLQSNRWTKTTSLVSDGVPAFLREGRFFPASAAVVQDAEEALAFSPNRLVLTALASADARLEPEVMLHGFPQHVVAFTWKKVPVRIFLNPNTNLPTAFEYTNARPADVFWSVWGDITTRVTYAGWTLEPNGIRFPRHSTVERNGMTEYVWDTTAVSFDPEIVGSDFNIPEDVRQAYAARPHAVDQLPLGNAAPARELADGVVQIPGLWNVSLVRQDDGVVVIEAPISPAYSAKVVDEVARRFPGIPIKAVITTSDSWPHIGGVREYVARKIPVYALDLNRPILERLLAAPHTLRPDLLARSPQNPRFEIVSGKVALGSGANRIEIYPYRTQTGERQMMVYLPNHKLLYSSDLFSEDGKGGYFTPQYVAEFLSAVRRERLSVETVFGMHLGPTKFDKVAH